MDRESGHRRQGRRHDPNPHRFTDGGECMRLEAVGDLHFEASAYSSALEYYRRILDGGALDGLDLGHALALQRKTIDAALNLGDLSLARELLKRAQEQVQAAVGLPEAERRLLAAPLLGREASLLVQRGSYADALLVCKRAFAVLAVTDNHTEVANLQVTMGVCHHRLGRLDKAEEFYSDALATFRRIGDDLGMAILYNNLALLQKNACRWHRALDFQRRSLELAASHGATHLMARLHLNEGIILRKAERRGEARASFEKCLRLSTSLGDLDRRTKACLALGQLDLLEGRLMRAEELVMEGQHLAEQAGYPREAAIADEYMGDIQAHRGEWDRALYNYELGLAKARVIGKSTDLEGELLRRIAEARAGQQRWREAATNAEAALEICLACGELFEIGFCHQVLGRALTRLGDTTGGSSHFKLATRTFRTQQLPVQAARSILLQLEDCGTAASREELIILRRSLGEVTESDAVREDEHLRGDLLRGFAEVLLRLGEHDEALIALGELDRVLASLEAPALTEQAEALRNRLELAMVGEQPRLDPQRLSIRAVGERSAAVQDALQGLLEAAITRTGAREGFVALMPLADHPVSDLIAASPGLPATAARKLTTWFADKLYAGSPAPRLISRPEPGTAFAKILAGLPCAAGVNLFVPIALPDKLYGLLFLSGCPDHPGTAVFRPALEFLATTAGFLAMNVAELERARPAAAAQAAPEKESALAGIVTGHPDMLRLLDVVRKVAASDLLVLLQGETGTGKGLFARAIHDLSHRAGRKYLAINCAAIPEALLESELFGHVRGSFTGAYGDKKGLLAEAAGGTVFLDEIGKLPLGMQGKILLFLDSMTIRPVGSNVDQVIDVRIICATKSDLKAKVASGEFLEDLYYRLLDFPLAVPPLRDRREDIGLLVPHFISRYAAARGIEPPGYTAAFMEALSGHPWPGNVRELVKAINRAIVLAHGEPMLRPDHLPAEIVPANGGAAASRSPSTLREVLGAVEAREIARVLAATGGNKAAASRLLGISYPNLLKKIRLYDSKAD